MPKVDSDQNSTEPIAADEQDDNTPDADANKPPVDAITVAYIHLLRGTGLHQSEIAEQVGLGQNRVSELLTRTAERVRDGKDPVDVYADVLAPIHLLDPIDGNAGGGE